MIFNAHRPMKYLTLMISAAYILSIGSVYAQTNQTNQTNQTGQTSQDVTGPIIAQALKSLMDAKQAYDSGNKTGALDEVHQAMWYLQTIGLPKNCIIDNNQMLQCNFPG
jgi:hypothetical protein